MKQSDSTIHIFLVFFLLANGDDIVVQEQQEKMSHYLSVTVLLDNISIIYFSSGKAAPMIG